MIGDSRKAMRDVTSGTEGSRRVYECPPINAVAAYYYSVLNAKEAALTKFLIIYFHSCRAVLLL